MLQIIDRERTFPGRKWIKPSAELAVSHRRVVPMHRNKNGVEANKLTILRESIAPP
ncbi:hypothetical protein JW960_00065 [candidate division KSB1 bacterium]|nr:hypothetical protein [candidate division KSB1 bacterium]